MIERPQESERVFLVVFGGELTSEVDSIYASREGAEEEADRLNGTDRLRATQWRVEEWKLRR